VIDVIELVGTVFSGLSALIIEDVEDTGEVICVRARARDGAVACPECGTETARVHEYREQTVADVPAGGRRVLVKVRVRRMRCPVTGCPRPTGASLHTGSNTPPAPQIVIFRTRRPSASALLPPGSPNGHLSNHPL
jgi:hypothetical protein